MSASLQGLSGLSHQINSRGLLCVYRSMVGEQPLLYAWTGLVLTRMLQP